VLRTGGARARPEEPRSPPPPPPPSARSEPPPWEDGEDEQPLLPLD